MDQLVKEFSLLGIAAMAVMVVLGVAFTRKILTLSFVMPWLKPDRRKVGNEKRVKYVNRFAEFYNEVGLYLLPYVFAAGFAFINSKFLFGDVSTYGGKLFLAFLVATFSGLIVKAVKKGVPGLFGQKVETEDVIVGPPVSG